MTTDAIGGVWQYSLELARGLGEHGVSVLLAVMGGGLTEARRAEVARLPHVRVIEHAGMLEWLSGGDEGDQPWNDVRESGDWLLRGAAAFQPDIVHLNSYSHGALAWKLPVVVVAHSCVLSWFHAVRGVAAPESWNMYRNAVRAGLHAADLVIAPSEFMLREVAWHYGAPENATVISNARRPEDFPPAAKQPLILCAGRLWDDAKNFQVLDRVAADVQWPIFIAGDAEHPEGGRKDAGGLQPLGRLDSSAMANWYGRASIYASPALYEPFGLTVLEAALAACALVLSDIPSFREIWGDAACYVNPADPGAWRDCLNALAADPARVAALAAAASARARRYNSAQMTCRYLDAYRTATDYRKTGHRPCASHSSVIPSDPTGIMEMPIFSAA
jgi:glycosyltransferase involved in cell wall biosynthesis